MWCDPIPVPGGLVSPNTSHLPVRGGVVISASVCAPPSMMIWLYEDDDDDNKKIVITQSSVEHLWTDFSVLLFSYFEEEKTLRILQSFNNSVEADCQLLTIQIKYLFPIKQSVNIYLTIRQASQKNDTILPVVPAWSWILRCCYIAMSTDEMLYQWRQWETMFDFVLILL